VTDVCVCESRELSLPISSKLASKENLQTRKLTLACDSNRCFPNACHTRYHCAKPTQYDCKLFNSKVVNEVVVVYFKALFRLTQE
jgi:hypothetical protein